MKGFYSVNTILQEENTTSVLIQMNVDHPIYQAHFPGHPITPGAMIVAMAVELINTQRSDKRDCIEAKNVKFLQPHYPEFQSRLTFIFDATVNPVEVIVRQDNVQYAKMTLFF